MGVCRGTLSRCPAGLAIFCWFVELGMRRKALEDGVGMGVDGWVFE